MGRPAISVQPLSGWRGPATQKRKASPFRATWSTTLDLLDKELYHLHAAGTTVELDVTDAQAAGGLKASLRPGDPRVRLSFNSRVGRLLYQCDRFTGWTDNLRAIALGLEALRKIQRYGIAEAEEQYQGWAELTGGETLYREDTAVDILRRHAGVNPASDLPLDALFKRARVRTHPDRHQGATDAWREVAAAATVLGLL